MLELEPLKNTYSIGEKGILAQISKNILSYLHFRSSERDFWLFWIFIIIFFIFMFFFSWRCPIFGHPHVFFRSMSVVFRYFNLTYSFLFLFLLSYVYGIFKKRTMGHFTCIYIKLYIPNLSSVN